MIDMINDPGFKEQDGWKKLVVSSMEALAIPCALYADVILDFVLDFGGGVDAPEIRFMHNVAQQFGASKTLGQQYWAALAKTNFPHQAQCCPLLRVALALVNLSAHDSHVEDNIARLLLKSHVTKVASKAKTNVAEVFELTLSKA